MPENFSDEPVFVANWSSEDFSRVYLKYRPALERHARKWLTDPTEIDEVVQDAFLYLFLSLPELDSEIGVLRFLKWKTRLLCLDVLRAHNRRPILLPDAADSENEPSDEDGPEAVLERMHDAAIVHAALAKIPERQREVLLRAEFQNESAAEIGQSLGLTENASRQLLHRARKSFKDSLVQQMGAIDVDVSEILSVAVRKAKQNASKGIALVTLFALAMAGAAGQSWMSWSGNGQVEISESVGEFPTVLSPDTTETETVTPSPSVEVSESPPKDLSPRAENSPTPSTVPSPTSTVEELETSESTGTSFSFEGVTQAGVETSILEYSEDELTGTRFSVSSENGLVGEFVLNQSESQIFLDVILLDQATGAKLDLDQLKLSRAILEDGSVRFVYIYQVLSPESAFTGSFIGVVVHFNLDMTLRATPLISELFS